MSLLSEINGGDVRLVVKYPRTDLVVFYDSNEYTPDIERNAQKSLKEGLGGTYLRKVLYKMLKSWDLKTDQEIRKPERPEKVGEGELVIAPGEIPLNERVLDQVMNIFGMQKIFAAIMEDQRPKPVTSEESDDTF